VQEEEERTHSRNKAIDSLSQHLLWTMNRLDPSEGDMDWDNLMENDREFYRSCVRELLARREHILAALD
jgi:hypothetical protein